MLIAIGGLPGVGKTTVARGLAGGLSAAHLRIDALETVLLTTGLVTDGADVGAAGYALALAVADSCLAVGTGVVVDAVFPVAASRDPWTSMARRYGLRIHWVRLVCSDPTEHRRRVESRGADIPGQILPDWPAVAARETDDWTEPHVVVDTAAPDPVAALQRLLS